MTHKAISFIQICIQTLLNFISLNNIASNTYKISPQKSSINIKANENQLSFKVFDLGTLLSQLKPSASLKYPIEEISDDASIKSCVNTAEVLDKRINYIIELLPYQLNQFIILNKYVSRNRVAPFKNQDLDIIVSIVVYSKENRRTNTKYISPDLIPDKKDLKSIHWRITTNYFTNFVEFNSYNLPDFQKTSAEVFFDSLVFCIEGSKRNQNLNTNFGHPINEIYYKSIVRDANQFYDLPVENLMEILKQNLVTQYPLMDAFNLKAKELRLITYKRIESLLQQLPYKVGDYVVLDSKDQYGRYPIEEIKEIKIYSEYIKENLYKYLNGPIEITFGEKSEGSLYKIKFKELKLYQIEAIFTSIKFGINGYKSYNNILRIANEKEREEAIKQEENRKKQRSRYYSSRISLRDAFGDDDLWNLMDC